MDTLTIRCFLCLLLLVNFLVPVWADDPVELVIWAEPYTCWHIMHSDPAEGGRYGLYLKEQFEREHPGVTVIIDDQGWDEALRQNLVNAMQIGTAPDVFVGENYFQPFIEQGALLPLNDYIGDIKDDLIPATYKAAQDGDTIYGVAAFTGLFGFERNCQVITSAGLECDTPPATWAELLEQVKTITERGQGNYYGYTLQGPSETSVGAVLRIAPLLAQSGATLCRKNCTEPYFNDPKAVPVMELLRELNQFTPPGLTFHPGEGDVAASVFHGRSAYQIAGSWHPSWAKDSGCEDCRYSSIPAPEHGRPASILVGNVIYAVLKSSAHPELAAEWVAFLARSDVQELVYPALGRLPSTRSALTALYDSVDPAMQVFINELLHTPELGILPQWREKPNELWGIYNQMLKEVLTSDRPVTEIMDEAQRAAEKLL